MAVQPQQSSIFGLLMSPHHAYDAWPGQAISVAGGGQQFGHAHCQWSSPRFDWWLVMSVCPLTLQFGPRSEANSQRRLHIVSPFFFWFWGHAAGWLLVLFSGYLDEGSWIRDAVAGPTNWSALGPVHCELSCGNVLDAVAVSGLEKSTGTPRSSIWPLNRSHSCSLWFDGFY